jgi:hypothetical protein
MSHSDRFKDSSDFYSKISRTFLFLSEHVIFSRAFSRYSLLGDFSLEPLNPGPSRTLSLKKGGREGDFGIPTPSRGGEKEGLEILISSRLFPHEYSRPCHLPIAIGRLYVYLGTHTLQGPLVAFGLS